MKEFSKIAEKHKIEYFLIAGTLLGAVRHQGFIPWDDDIDLGITRESYEKIKEINFIEENKKLILVDYYNDDYYTRPHAKIALKNTKYRKRKWGENYDYITVSLFIFDKVPDKENERVKQYKKHKNLTRLLIPASIKSKDRFLFLRDEYFGIIKKIIYFFMSFFIKRKNIVKRSVRNMSKYKNKKTQYVFPFATFYRYSKALIPSEWLESQTKVVFEGEMYPTFKNYVKYLEKMYVDLVVAQENMDKYEAWSRLNFDVIFHGDDWKNSAMYNEIESRLRNEGVDFVYFPYTKGISSTKLREIKK